MVTNQSYGPMRMRSASPLCTGLAGFARLPFTSTFPPVAAAAARARVLKKRATHNHLSSRTLSPVMLKGIISAMKWVLIVMGSVAALFVLMALIGLFIAREHRATSTIVLRQAPDTVWKVVRDIGSVASWFPAMKRAERLPDRDGHEVWRQKIGGFEAPIIVLESSAPRKLVTQIDPAAGGSFGGTWTYMFTPDSNATRISVTEAGWIGNPVFRFMARFLFGYYGSLDGYLKALGKRFGESVQPTHS